MIAREKRLRVFNTALLSEKTRARGLQLDVIARPELTLMAFH